MFQPKERETIKKEKISSSNQPEKSLINSAGGTQPKGANLTRSISYRAPDSQQADAKPSSHSSPLEDSLKEPPSAWRRWESIGDTSNTNIQGKGSEVKHIPTSTFNLPDDFTHMTHYAALPSIRENGLDPKRKNSTLGLNRSAGTAKFVARDDYLQAVYLGTSAQPGTAMLDEDAAKTGGRVELRVKVPRDFKHANLRDVHAVIARNGEFNDVSNGDTALSFASIPPQYLHIVAHDEEGKEVLHPLVNLLPEGGNEYDFRKFATKPHKNYPKLISNEEIAQNNLKRESSAMNRSVDLINVENFSMERQRAVGTMTASVIDTKAIDKMLTSVSKDEFEEDYDRNDEEWD